MLLIRLTAAILANDSLIKLLRDVAHLMASFPTVSPF